MFEYIRNNDGELEPVEETVEAHDEPVAAVEEVEAADEPAGDDDVIVTLVGAKSYVYRQKRYYQNEETVVDRKTADLLLAQRTRNGSPLFDEA